MFGDATPDIIRASIKETSARLVFADGLEPLQPSDCSPQQVRAVMGVVAARLVDVGDEDGVMEVGDGENPAALGAVFDNLYARLDVVGNVYRPTGLGDYVGTLDWGDEGLNHAYAAIIAADLTSVSGGIYLNEDGLLTLLDVSALESVGSDLSVTVGVNAFDFSSLRSIGNLFAVENTDLVSLDCSGITSIYALGINNNASLMSIEPPTVSTMAGNFEVTANAVTGLACALTSVGGDFKVTENSGLASLELPLLASVGGDFLVYVNSSLPSVDLLALTTVGGDFSVSTDSALETVQVPVLESIGGTLSIAVNGALTTLDLSSVTSIGQNVEIQGNTSLTTLDVSGLMAVGAEFNASETALDQASVDALLVRLAALDGTGGTTAYNDLAIQITGTSLPPSATGLAAIAILESTDRGCTVTVNS